VSEIDVSVITPTFHRERQVVTAIDSVLGQSGVSVEVIVLDDSAEGSACEAVRSVNDPRVRYVKRAVPSQGKPALVRNEGARLARGRFLHFLDDDDVLEPGALAALTGALQTRSGAGMAFGGIVPFGNDERELRRQEDYFRSASRTARSLHGRMNLTARLLFLTTVLVNSACMARREAFVASGGYDPQVPVCEDVELWMRIVRATDFVYVDRPILRYRTGNPSLMASLAKNDEKLRVAYGRMYRKYRDTYGSIEFFALKMLARLVLQWLQ
jgi:glycosyltransferase involved in cell wall biosynthesis